MRLRAAPSLTSFPGLGVFRTMSVVTGLQLLGTARNFVSAVHKAANKHRMGSGIEHSACNDSAYILLTLCLLYA